MLRCAISDPFLRCFDTVFLFKFFRRCPSPLPGYDERPAAGSHFFPNEEGASLGKKWLPVKDANSVKCACFPSEQCLVSQRG